MTKEPDELDVMDMKQKAQPVQLQMKQEIFVDSKNVVKIDSAKFQSMLIKKEPINEYDFKPKVELKEKYVVFERAIEETINIEIDVNTVLNTLRLIQTEKFDLFKSKSKGKCFL